MSSTNRGVERIDKDFYGTPISFVREFLPEFIDVAGPDAFAKAKVFDPCAGGGSKYSPQMPYPQALSELGIKCDTLDIRPESPAKYHGDYLAFDTVKKLRRAPNVIISDSCEYAHFCWRKGENPDHTEFRVIVKADEENVA